MSRFEYLRGAFLAAMGVSFIFAAPANALTFNFTIDNTVFVPPGFPSGVAGSVTGDIVGLTAGATSAASAIDILSVPSGSGLFTGSYSLAGATNAFTVSAGGVLTVANFVGGVSLLTFNWNSTTGGFAFLQSATGCNASDPASSGCAVVFASTAPSGNSGSIGFTPASETSATPLPAALPLFASGGGLLGFLGWRRRRKNAAPVAA